MRTSTARRSSRTLAVLTSEGIHGGVRHDLRDMVALVPEENPIKPHLVALVPLAAYATAFRYPTSSRIPASPRPEVLQAHLANVAAALDASAVGFGVELLHPTSPATHRGPLR